jgi:hypothetical protein
MTTPTIRPFSIDYTIAPELIVIAGSYSFLLERTYLNRFTPDVCTMLANNFKACYDEKKTLEVPRYTVVTQGKDELPLVPSEMILLAVTCLTHIRCDVCHNIVGVVCDGVPHLLTDEAVDIVANFEQHATLHSQEVVIIRYHSSCPPIWSTDSVESVSNQIN